MKADLSSVISQVSIILEDVEQTGTKLNSTTINNALLMSNCVVNASYMIGCDLDDTFTDQPSSETAHVFQVNDA